jgi:YgiT-type zinc finger domain-containing protein
MRRATAPFHVDRKGYHLTFDTVPAWVCVQCGEVYFEDTELEAIQEVIQTIEQQTPETMLVPA